MNKIEGCKLTILVVEDNPADVDLLRRALRHAKLDCELMVVEDGAEALDLIHRREESAVGPLTDLAIVDLNLPKHSGEEILRALQTSPSFAKIPVAVLSSNPRDRLGVRAPGAGRYILKSPDLDEFLRIGFTIREFLIETRPDGPTGS